MKSIYSKLFTKPNIENNLKVQHNVKTYKEFFYHHNTNQDYNSQLEINTLLAQLRVEIENFVLHYCDLSKHEPISPINLNETQFDILFNDFKNKVLANCENNKLYQWLSLNIQSHFSTTIEILKRHAKRQFINLLSSSHVWVDTYKSDAIFKYTFIDILENKICNKKVENFSFNFCSNILKHAKSDDLFLTTTNNYISIGYQTMFQCFATDIHLLPFPTRLSCIRELEKRISSQKHIDLINETKGASIYKLARFYQLFLSELKNLPAPLKFTYRSKGDLSVFRKICSYFNRRHKLFNCSVDDLIDLISSDSKLGTTFSVSKEKESTFFLFIHILSKECITGKIHPVIRDRFVFDEINPNLSDNGLAAKKKNRLKVYSDDEIELIHKQALS
ncbi:hypothetical protein [Carboxylicivirga caseinilyticus]|uniref:hypothetical protein n=1 Tax=Carboxylicivirga caseinilyticus TaxID=3417572 RepID=UPI003D32B25E|nr:hypothetical protein [Marinilabiliaceae bacterium A049]